MEGKVGMGDKDEMKNMIEYKEVRTIDLQDDGVGRKRIKKER